MKKPITISVAGQRYAVKGADEDHLKRLASFIDERVEDARKVAKAASPQHLLVLAALNMADELFSIEARRRALEEETRARVKRVLGRLT
ncbi:MAG: cell division protein ZapA [Deltaproteobacteria bacterium]|nr:cell division protein ZapA [Deltaproteobacteria bacterium]